MNKPVKCFIVEGLDRDYRFVNELVTSLFKGRYSSITIFLPAEQNIYMLYQKLEEDDFETDLVELLRESSSNAEQALKGIDRQKIDEVFLFFDYDIHQRNLAGDQDPLVVLRKMISFFNNETENGKLYISYPMVEALYDYVDGYCESFTKCLYPIDEIDCYKEKVGTNNRNASRHYTRYQDWKMIFSIFGLKMQCLFCVDRIDYSFYSKKVTVESIFDRQNNYYLTNNVVFILSAFPEFVLDYFKEPFWNANINQHRNKYFKCPKKELPNPRLS